MNKFKITEEQFNKQSQFFSSNNSVLVTLQSRARLVEEISNDRKLVGNIASDFLQNEFSEKQQEELKNGKMIRVWEGFMCRSRYSLDNNMIFSIIAPQREFDLKKKKIKKYKIEPEDPVVLYEITDKLFIIITAWDKEALAPEIFNENKN